MKLLLENWREYLIEQNIAYSGIVLDEESRQKLLELPIPEGWEPIAHHMTITVGPLQHPKGKHDFSEIYPIGAEVELPVVAVGLDDRAMAVKVVPPADVSKKYHFLTLVWQSIAKGEASLSIPIKSPKRTFNL